MKQTSIKRRINHYTIVVAVVLVLSLAMILTELFSASVQRNFDRQLDIILFVLVGELAGQVANEQQLEPPGSLSEPRFELPLSGWYWTITKQSTGEIMLSSDSLVGGEITLDASSIETEADDNKVRAFGTGPDGKTLRILERRIKFNDNEIFNLRVTGNAQQVFDQVRTFRYETWTLLLIAAVLAGFFVFRTNALSLQPLEILRDRVRDVSEGRAQIIEGDYPLEVSALVDETNNLLNSNKETLERARTQVGNLAHALKTPLSVIVNEARDVEGESAELLQKQAKIMSDHIQLYLERARMAARHNVLGVTTKANPVLERLVGVMAKIHAYRGIDIELRAKKPMLFRGDEHDLEEMVGNIVDNGCKWASSKVIVTLGTGTSSKAARHQSSGSNAWLDITIEDDGKGLSEDELRKVTERGLRLDESKPGSGLGLSIVEELVALYRGEFRLSRSDLGGLKIDLILPALPDDEDVG